MQIDGLKVCKKIRSFCIDIALLYSEDFCQKMAKSLYTSTNGLRANQNAKFDFFIFKKIHINNKAIFTLY